MIEQEVLIKNISVMRDFYQRENTDPVNKVIKNLFLLITYFLIIILSHLHLKNANTTNGKFTPTD